MTDDARKPTHEDYPHIRDEGGTPATAGGPQVDGKAVPYDPDTPVEARAGATAAMLKDDIASGRTGDKQGFPDPGAAPLGAGAEAAGAPTSRGQWADARDQETARPDDRVSDDEARPVTPDGPGGD